MEERQVYWVALNLVLSEKLRIAQKIIRQYSSLEEVFRTPWKELVSLGLDEERARTISSPKILRHAQKEIDRLQKKGYSLFTLEDQNYPGLLKEIYDPPFVLYCAGSVGIWQDPTVAVIGARKPSPYGRAVAERLAEDLASRGIVVVSGLARGIDSIAHWGALKGGKTIAVLGSGLENIYPPENRRLAQKISENGAVISEYPLDAEPLGFHFPQRNRIIAGLSSALVVVEASRKSGSLISAGLALEQNREVMAVPGNVTVELSRGTNWLIKNGAKPVEDWEDVAEEFPSPLRERLLFQKDIRPPELPFLAPKEKQILNLLQVDALVHIDTLLENCEYSISELLTVLLDLELKGLIVQSPGKYFQRRM
ncbi:MAG: DNA-processing protein DprA [Candidatus Aminicenantales bacterium]